MKIIVTADIHYGVGQNQLIVKKLVRRIISTKADILIIVGDTFAFRTELLNECLQLFDDFKGDKLLVAGNHDLWTYDNNSLVVYNKILPQIAKKNRFHFLDQKPFIKNQVGFVGSIGWYDFSFCNPNIIIPKKYYLEKSWPGVVTYNDGRFVHLGMNDVKFTQKINRKLKLHLAQVSKSSEKIICSIHHVPFKELLRSNNTSADWFLTAFSGSEKTGDIIKSFPKVQYVFCGHTHQKKKAQIGGITAINVGSDYSQKRFEVIDI